MNFLNPAMFAGFAALAIPIIVHLLNRRRFKKVPWAAMRFLQVSLERNQRRMKVEDYILLLLRLLIVALIVLALARPAADWIKGRFLGSKVAAAMIVDSSGSMGRKDGGSAATRFELARTATGEVIAGLPRGSAVSVLLAGDTAGTGISEPTFDLERAEKTLGKGTLTDRSSDLLPSIDAAIASLDERTASGKELVIVTDGDATAWRQFESITRRLEAAGEDVRAVVAIVGGKPGENLALTRLAQNTPIAAVGQPLRLSVEVTNFGLTEAENVPVSLEVDSEPASNAIEIESIPPGETRTVTLFARLPSPGFHRVAASLAGGDALPADDRRTLVVRAIEQERVLLVDGQPGRDAASSETFFLQNALVPAPPEFADAFYIATDTVTVAEFPGAALGDYRAVFLANVAEFTATAAEQLAEYVRAGGGLVVFPGANVNRSFYNTELHDNIGLLPAEFGDIIPADAGAPLTLQASGYDHPLVALWNDPGAGTLADVEVGKAFALDLADGAGAAVVLRYSDGSPAVVESDFGLGKVYQFSSTADNEWNDLPVRPAFLPIVHRVLGSVLARRDAGLNLSVGEPFVRRGPASWAENKKVATIYSAGAGASKGSLVEIVADGDGSRAEFPGAETAGAYEFSLADPPVTLPFAANPDPRESDPEQLSAAQLDRLRAVAEVVSLSAGASLSEALGRKRSGAEIWPLLLLAAGLLAVLEMFLAQRFSKEK